ncbi:hypothetical protein [Pedobacter frigoris]|uniref:hypothetical protein n=1 Tax=Pedobacter frigoris TaxID=2571272 RepID=UPI0029303C03|nr:hypothetical protein [Pedobacter frigoris]
MVKNPFSFNGRTTRLQCGLLICVLLFATKSTIAQSNTKTDDIRLQVLRTNHVGKTYKFNTEDNSVTHLRFLGTIHTKEGKKYKILTSIWTWGLSKRATSRILVYTDQNKYIGNYYLTTIDDVPNYIKNNKLVFLNKGRACDPKLVTYVSFDNGVPKEFFRKCKGNDGDFFTFSSD